jgi:hypothetical protein
VGFGGFVIDVGWKDGVGGELLSGAGEWAGTACLFVGGEIGGGDLEVLDQECGSLEVDMVAGEAGGRVGESFLDGGPVVKMLDEERVVLDDGGNVVRAMLVAHVLVVHGGSPAASAVLF